MTCSFRVQADSVVITIPYHFLKKEKVHQLKKEEKKNYSKLLLINIYQLGRIKV